MHTNSSTICKQPIFLTGQQITQSNNTADSYKRSNSNRRKHYNISRGTSVVVTEIEINDETVTGTFVNGETLTGISNVQMISD